MGSGQTHFQDTYGLSHEAWKFHTKGGTLGKQCPHTLSDPDHINLCKLNNLAVCMLETSVSQTICTEWESIKAEWKEEPNGS